MWLFACLVKVLVFLCCLVGWPVKVLPQGNRNHPSIHTWNTNGKKENIYIETIGGTTASSKAVISKWVGKTKHDVLQMSSGRLAMFNILYKMVISLLWLLWWLLVRYHFIWNLSHMKIDRTNKTQTQYNNREKNALEILVRSFNSRRINDIVVKNENRFDFYDSFFCISNWKFRNGFPIIFKAKTPKFAIYLRIDLFNWQKHTDSKCFIQRPYSRFCSLNDGCLKVQIVHEIWKIWIFNSDWDMLDI